MSCALGGKDMEIRKYKEKKRLSWSLPFYYPNVTRKAVEASEDWKK